MFDKNPIFTTKGTCYTTNATIYEHSPFIYSSVKIWIHELKENTPGTKGKSVDGKIIFSLKVQNLVEKIW